MIHSYAYRTPRVHTSFPVEYVTNTGVLLGHTKDISEQGLSADFGEPVLPGTSGRVRFRTGHCLLELEAQVTHSEGFLAGLAFAFSSEQESAFVRAVLQVLTRARSQEDTLSD